VSTAIKALGKGKSLVATTQSVVELHYPSNLVERVICLSLLGGWLENYVEQESRRRFIRTVVSMPCMWEK
jgi:hypothetical protein